MNLEDLKMKRLLHFMKCTFARWWPLSYDFSLKTPVQMKDESNNIILLLVAFPFVYLLYNCE